jgi:hypothetical protein
MPGYEPSNTVGAEKRKVQADYMAEQALPQRLHDPLAGPFQSDNLEKIGNKPDNDNPQENGGDPGYTVHPHINGQ